MAGRRKIRRNLTATWGHRAAVPVACAFLASSAMAQNVISSCVAQFVSECSFAASSPELYLERLNQRTPPAVVSSSGTSDNMAAVYSVLKMLDPNGGTGILEQTTIGVNQNVQQRVCHVMCTQYSGQNAVQLNAEFLAGLAAHAPNAIRTGGALPNSVQARMNNMSGDFLYLVRNWAADPSHVMHATVWDGEVQMTVVSFLMAGE